MLVLVNLYIITNLFHDSWLQNWKRKTNYSYMYTRYWSVSKNLQLLKKRVISNSSGILRIPRCLRLAYPWELSWTCSLSGTWLLYKSQSTVQTVRSRSVTMSTSTPKQVESRMFYTNNDTVLLSLIIRWLL